MSSPPSLRFLRALLSFVASSAGVRLCFLKNDDIAADRRRVGLTSPRPWICHSAVV